MEEEAIYFDLLVDPNGNEHQPRDEKCSGCDWDAPSKICTCGGLNHYWFVEDDGRDVYVAYECEKCGGFKDLQPVYEIH